MEKCKFVLNPEKDFTRDRKMDFTKTIFMALCMKGESTWGGICEFWNYSNEMPSTTAFRKQFAKIK